LIDKYFNFYIIVLCILVPICCAYNESSEASASAASVEFVADVFVATLDDDGGDAAHNASATR
jgi:hypothetical protein